MDNRYLAILTCSWSSAVGLERVGGHLWNYRCGNKRVCRWHGWWTSHKMSLSDKSRLQKPYFNFVVHSKNSDEPPPKPGCMLAKTFEFWAGDEPRTGPNRFLWRKCHKMFTNLFNKCGQLYRFFKIHIHASMLISITWGLMCKNTVQLSYWKLAYGQNMMCVHKTIFRFIKMCARLFLCIYFPYIQLCTELNAAEHGS